MNERPVLSQPVFVREMGEGERKALALHCTIGHSGAWAKLAAALRTQASLVAPDMLSHGRSPDWDGAGDLFDRMTEMALAQLTEPMDVIGHSFGGMIALWLAIKHPELVRSAVLIEPVFFAIAKRDAPELIAQHDREAQPYLDALAAGDNATAARLFNRMWSDEDGPRWPDLPESSRSAMIRGIHVVSAVEGTLLNDRSGMLHPGAMDHADMPILVLSGSETHPVMPAVCEGLQRRLPNASHTVIAGAGHMLPISHPAETATKVQEFWSSLALASA